MGGVGLCEYVQHPSVFDFLSVSTSLYNRIIEFIDHLHEYFLTPVNIRNRRYLLPQKPGYSIHISEESLTRFAYPLAKLEQQGYKSRLHLSAKTHRDMPFLGDWGRALSECRCALPPDQRSVEWLPSVPPLAMHVAISSQENRSVLGLLK